MPEKRIYSPIVLSIVGVIATCSFPQSIAYAQSTPVFEAKPSASFRGPGRFCDRLASATRAPQRIEFQSWLLGDLLAFAYDLPLDRIERRPQWTYDECFDVAVTTPAPASLAEQKRLLVALLEDRFGLVARRVFYPSPVYSLTRGSNVTLTEESEPEFGILPQSSAHMLSKLYASSIGDLTASLTRHLQLPVVDNTGLTGLFDIAIDLPARITESGVTTAVQSALGLNLERREGTAESLIIERLEKASN